MHGFFDLLMLVFELNDFGIDKQSQPIGGQWPGEEVLGFLVKFLQELFDLFGAIAQTQSLERAAGSGEATGAQQDVAQQLLIGFRQITLMFWQDRRIKALPGSWALQVYRGGADVQGALWSIAVGAVLGMLLQVKLALALQSSLKDMSQAGLQELGQILWAQLALQFRALGQLSEELIEVRLHRRRVLIIFHVHQREGKEGLLLRVLLSP